MVQQQSKTKQNRGQGTPGRGPSAILAQRRDLAVRHESLRRCVFVERQSIVASLSGKSMARATSRSGHAFRRHRLGGSLHLSVLASFSCRA
eukprot:2460436-Rhodomonas_salina.1